MKKIKWMLLFATVTLFSCSFQDDPVKYLHTMVGFPNQGYVRNVIVGEGLEMNIGVTFSGIQNNTMQREVGYEIDPTLVPTSKTILPADYYTLSHPNTITINKGKLDGYLNVKLDSVKFLADPQSLTGVYVIPIKLVSKNNIDSINQSKNYMVVSVSYFAKQEANYTYYGTVTKTKGSTTTSVRFKSDPTQNNSFRLLKTTGPTTMKLVADPIGANDPAKGVYSLLVNVPILGGNVTIAADPASAIAVSPVAGLSFYTAQRTFTLSYTYTLNDGTVCNAADTLVYRNRIRDMQANGVYINDWR
jgi:hypothetical protein